MKTSTKHRLLCVVDKKHPINHSFVDDMLSKNLPDKNLRVSIICSQGIMVKKPVKYNKSSLIPLLKKRKGFNRFLNFFILYFLMRKLITKYTKKNEKVSVFIRNEPIYLLVASLLRKKYCSLIYQQSFPHEFHSKKDISIKKRITKKILRVCKNNINLVLGVSELSLIRLRKIFGDNQNIVYKYIPLLVDKNIIIDEEMIKELKGNSLKFIYIGTHAKIRNLNIVIEAAIEVLNAHKEDKMTDITFTFIGGNKRDIERLSSEIEKYNIYDYKEIIFLEKIPRNELLNILPDYDVGISLIPPLEIYKESSPTKLTEYMAKGLPVLASKGIDLQEEIIRKSNTGWLIEFNKTAIRDAFENIILNNNELTMHKKNARNYIVTNFTYDKYAYIIKNNI